MSATDCTPTAAPRLVDQIRDEPAQTTNPDRRRVLTHMEQGALMWEQRDEAAAHVLALAPAPTLPCPSWCAEDSGHGLEDHEDGRVLRWHSRDLSPEGPEGYARAKLSRADELLLASRQERVSTASRVNVEVSGDGGGAPALTSVRSREVASVLLEAGRLLAESARGGDPEVGF